MSGPRAVDITALESLLVWRESRASGGAIAAAVDAARVDGADPAAGLAAEIIGSARRLVLTGAGSSYFLAQAAAAAARETTGRQVVAAPLSELLLRPASVLERGSPADEPIVIVSRSGATSEAVSVAEKMRAIGHPTIAITCRAGSPLAARANATLVSPAGDETAIVMTQSFASMLAMLLRALAATAPDGSLAADLDQVAGRWPEAVAAGTVGRRLGATSWSRVVVLGGGASFGIASEWCLKLTETSRVPANAYEPLEFRHGPISVCERGMLLVALIGGPGARDELRVVSEAAALGAETWVIARDAHEAQGAPGAVSLIGAGLQPSARLPLLVHPAHALAIALALTRGCDPDAPRHLGQVVTISFE